MGTMIGRRNAVQDAELVARVVHRRPLMYSAGADASLDRPAHVRAGSGLAWLGQRLVVVQDDAHFLAIVDLVSGAVESMTLPVGAEGLRQFDDTRGNKAWKLDLETCTTIEEDGRVTLLALGSGSTSRREQALCIDLAETTPREIRLIHASAFYGGLRQQLAFSGTALNIEGAIYLSGGVLRLFQRGNGAVCNNSQPVNATCDVCWKQLADHWNDPSQPAPQPTNIIQYELGALSGTRLAFTDATMRQGVVYFAATAEASADAVCDGPVAGSVLGRFDADGTPRWTVLLDRAGDCLCVKVEGLVLDAAQGSRGWLLIDHDDPARPAELCEVALGGPW